jgi:signal transduction histidine kinase
MTKILPDDADRQMLEDFAANVAHDFNNLLTGILGNLELMQSRAARGGITQFDGYLEGARNAGGRAAIFAQRLLAFSGRAAQDFADHDLSTILGEVITMLPDAGKKISFSAAPAMLFCDAAQAALAFQELLTNAADAVAEGGAITVRVKAAGGLRVTLQDSGAGMAPEVLARALEPFYSTRPNGAGKGLGLAIAERFARQTGGTLMLESTLGRGTTVTLQWPRLGG